MVLFNSILSFRYQNIILKKLKLSRVSVKTNLRATITEKI